MKWDQLKLALQSGVRIISFAAGLVSLVMISLVLISDRASAVESSFRAISPLCPEKLESFENIQIQQSLSSDGKTCYFSVHPRDAFETMIYRDYLLTSDGLLMVFNSYDSTEESLASGAREFYFLGQVFSEFQWFTEEGLMKVRGLGGLTYAFDLTSAQLKTLTGAQLKLAAEVSPTNKGGLEVESFAGIWIDASFRLGGSPAMSSTATSQIRNGNSETCRAPNSSLFQYIDGNAYVRNLTELKKNTRIVCPKFDWGQTTTHSTQE